MNCHENFVKVVAIRLLATCILVQASVARAESTATTTARAVLQQPDLHALTLYGVHVQSTIGQDPRKAAAYKAFAAQIKSLGAKYADSNGKEALQYAQKEEWRSIDRSLLGMKTLFSSADPKSTTEQLLAKGLPAIIGVGTTGLFGPYAGATAGVLSDSAIATFTDEVNSLRAFEAHYGGQYLPDLEPVSLTTLAMEVWLTCRDKYCIRIHDKHFKSTMDNTSIAAEPRTRLTRSPYLSNERRFLALEHTVEGLLRSGDSMGQATGDTSTPTRAVLLSRSLEQELSWPKRLASTRMAMTDDSTAGAISPEDIEASTTIAVALAGLAGQHKTAYALGVLGAQTANLMRTMDVGANATALATAAAGINVIVALVSVANVLASDDQSDTAAIMHALNHISTQLSVLQKDVTRGFFTAKATAVMNSHAALTRLDEISRRVKDLDVNYTSRAWRDRREDLSERLTRWNKLGRQIAALGQTCEWPDADIEQCSRELSILASTELHFDALPSIGPLPVNADDSSVSSYPFHFNYGILAKRLDVPGLDGFANPYYWEQIVRATLQSYLRTPPSSESEVRGRIARLQLLEAIGKRSAAGVKGIVFTGLTTDAVGLGRLLDEYARSLLEVADGLARSVLVDPGSVKLHAGQTALLDAAKLPVDPQLLTVLEVLLSRSEDNVPVLAACGGASDDRFLPQAVSIERPALGSGLRPHNERAAWTSGWSKSEIEGLALPPPSLVSITPAPIVWAVAAGFGNVRACLSAFRPLSVAFTARPITAWNYAASFEGEVELLVQFSPTQRDGSAEAWSTVASWGSTFGCKSMQYRPEPVPRYPLESRMLAVRNHASNLWAGRPSADCWPAEGSRAALTSMQVESEGGVVDQYLAELNARLSVEKLRAVGEVAGMFAFEEAQDEYRLLAMLVALQRMGGDFSGDAVEFTDSLDRLSSPLSLVRRMIDEVVGANREREWLEGWRVKIRAEIDAFSKENREVVRSIRESGREHPIPARIGKALRELELYRSAYEQSIAMR